MAAKVANASPSPDLLDAAPCAQQLPERDIWDHSH
jgi:hypothetical protein